MSVKQILDTHTHARARRYQYSAPDAGGDPGEGENVAVVGAAGRTTGRRVVILRAERDVAEEHVGDSDTDGG